LGTKKNLTPGVKRRPFLFKNQFKKRLLEVLVGRIKLARLIGQKGRLEEVKKNWAKRRFKILSPEEEGVEITKQEGVF